MSAPGLPEIVRTTLRCLGRDAPAGWVAETVRAAGRLRARRGVTRDEAVAAYLESRFRALAGGLH